MKETLIKNVTTKYKKGDMIFKEGTEGMRMYIVKSGRVQLKKVIDGKDVILATLGVKEFFGEMALFGTVYRTASAYALEDTEVIPINKKMLDVALEKAPDWLVILVRQLVQRLKATGEKVKHVESGKMQIEL